MSRSQADIERALKALLDKMAKDCGAYVENPHELVGSVLSSKIASKTVDMVESIVGTYTLDELVIASDHIAEISTLKKATSDDEASH